ncbi:putative sucrose-phosphate synthase 2 [Hibiscus syriacus]|uniref:sucrose-phosphate synthase n=1 Tax=Hibiscus syriacus TaxID=106335 RepID=A0A6A3CYW7_HIBSY|nr:putative sucrose-phosphate synthase 2 [Hibiscus syriacus]
MAANEWINGYLEAILDSGAAAKANGGLGRNESFQSNKVVATRNARERSSKLENMCWRIWHLTQDLAEVLSEGEKGDTVSELMNAETPRKILQRNFSNLKCGQRTRKKKNSTLSLSVRGENMELGRDSDTGGQVKYVVELSRALAKMPGVYRVDLFTRQVLSPEVDWSYGEPTEMLTTAGDENDVGESSGAYIIRIPFGPCDKYLHKELLWPYIQEFVDGALAHILNMSKVLGEQIGGGQPVWPYVIHGHYADAGDSTALLSGALNVPMVLTGHSLGRNKLEQLLKQGRQAVGLYDGFDVKLEKVLRARVRRGVNCHGRYMPRMVVIPPGMDFSNVVVQDDAPKVDGEIVSVLGGTDGSSSKAIPAIWSEVMRFLTNPHKTMILALSRPDPKKNITTLLKAFGECHPLRELANLTLVMGNRDDIDEMTGLNASVLLTVLKLIDKYDLYGQGAYPKHHKQNDVPDIYRLAEKKKAAAHGLPMVATKNGGPVDIQRELNNGLLVDPHNQQAIADALLMLISEKNLWHECRKNDVQDMSLRLSVDGDKASLTEYLDPVASSSGDPELQDQVKQVLSKIHKPETNSKETEGVKLENVASKYPILRRRRRLVVFTLDCYESKGFPDKKMVQIIQDIFKAVRLVTQTAKFTGFAMSTAMPVSETVDFFKSEKIQVNDFDALICGSGSGSGSGSEVYYPGNYTAEDGKLFADPDYASHEKKVDDLRQKLRMRGLRCHPMYCRNSTRIHVVPLLASRAQALRLNVANMFVIVGETGDTDYEELIAGAQKILIMKEVVTNGSEALLRTTYLRNDIVPSDGPSISSIKGGATPEEISEALKALSKESL